MPVLVQLFSARNLPSITDALDQVRAAGYDGVEGCWLNFEDPNAFRRQLESRDLKMPQAHLPLAMLEDDFDRAVAICRALGIHTVVAPWLEGADRPAGVAGWVHLGRRLDAVEGKLRVLGLRFAWHNHDFELVELADGRTPLQILLEAAPGMDWEADIGWILRAGQDPVSLLEAHAGRVTTVRLKDVVDDFDNAPEGGWADLGHGINDWVPIFETLRSLPRLAAWVAEHDEPADFGRFVARWKVALERFRSTNHDQLFEGFTHVALKVLDLENQLAFYGDIMGFREMFRLHNTDGSVFLVYLRINDRQYLELFPDAVGDHVPTPSDRGYQHICLEVANLDVTVSALRSRGARMCLWREDLSGIYEVDCTAITMGRDGNRQSWVEDPEGNRIELMELALSGSQYAAMATRLSPTRQS